MAVVAMHAHMLFSASRGASRRGPPLTNLSSILKVGLDSRRGWPIGAVDKRCPFNFFRIRAVLKGGYALDGNCFCLKNDDFAPRPIEQPQNSLRHFLLRTRGVQPSGNNTKFTKFTPNTTMCENVF